MVLIWGTTWAAIRIGLGSVPPFTGAALRFAISAAVLLAALPLFRIPFDASLKARRVWLANGLLLFSVSYGTVYWTEQWVPSGLAAILFATFPLLVAVLARFVLPGEHVSLWTWVGVLLGFAGVATIYSEDLAALAGARTRTAAAIFLLSPAATAVSNVLVKRWGGGLHPLTVTAVPMAIGAACLGAVAAGAERHLPVRWDAAAIASVAYLALFGSVLTFGLYFWLLARYPATKLALVAYGTPVVAVLVGTSLLDEPFTLRIGVGALAVLAGVALATRSLPPATARRPTAGPARTRGSRPTP
jgi:drug/metabolite transporter (DMT)-like permease